METKSELLTAKALRNKKFTKWQIRNYQWPRTFKTIAADAVRKFPHDSESAKEFAEIEIRKQLPSWNQQAIENAVANVQRIWWCVRSQPNFGSRYLAAKAYSNDLEKDLSEAREVFEIEELSLEIIELEQKISRIRSVGRKLQASRLLELLKANRERRLAKCH